jgi:hypothetical protein
LLERSVKPESIGSDCLAEAYVSYDNVLLVLAYEDLESSSFRLELGEHFIANIRTSVKV